MPMIFFPDHSHCHYFRKKTLTVVKDFGKIPKKATLQKAVIAKLALVNPDDLALIFWEETSVPKSI